VANTGTVVTADEKAVVREEVRILLKYMFEVGDPAVIREQLADVRHYLRAVRAGKRVSPPGDWSDNQCMLWSALRAYHGI